METGIHAMARHVEQYRNGFLFANIFVEMFQDTLTLRNLMLCAIGVILMIIVRMLTSMQASRYSYRQAVMLKIIFVNAYMRSCWS